jgi:hypothetical protein
LRREYIGGEKRDESPLAFEVNLMPAARRKATYQANFILFPRYIAFFSRELKNIGKRSFPEFP